MPLWGLQYLAQVSPTASFTTELRSPQCNSRLSKRATMQLWGVRREPQHHAEVCPNSSNSMLSWTLQWREGIQGAWTTSNHSHLQYIDVFKRRTLPYILRGNPKVTSNHSSSNSNSDSTLGGKAKDWSESLNITIVFEETFISWNIFKNLNMSTI